MGTLTLVILFVLALAIGAVFGVVRGLRRTTVRLMFQVASALISFLVAKPVAALIGGNIPLDMGMDELFAASPVLQAAAETLPVFLLAVVTLPVVFLLLQFITWIVFMIVRDKLVVKIFGGGLDGERLGGVGVGIVAGALCFGMLMAPGFALLDTIPASDAVDDAMAILVEQDVFSDADAEMIVDAYSATDNVIVKLYSGIGRTDLRGASKFSAEGETVYLMDELNTVVSALETALEGGLPAVLAAEGDSDAIFALLGDQTLADAILSDLLRSRIICAVLPGVAESSVKDLALGMNVPADKADTIAAEVRDSLKTAVADEETALETASVIATILPGVVDMIGGEDGPALESLDFNSIAAVVTALQNSELNGVGAALLDMVLYGEAGENATVRNLIATLKTHYENGDDLTGFFGSAGALLAMVSSTGESGDKVVAHMHELINNLDATSAEMIVSALSEDALVDLGIPEEHTGTAHAVVESVITGLADLKDSENYEAEADAIVPVLEMLTGDVSELGSEEIVQLAESTASSEVLHNTVVTLSETEDVDLALEDKELSRDVESAIREKYEQSESEIERQRYRDFAALLGLKLD